MNPQLKLLALAKKSCFLIILFFLTAVGSNEAQKDYKWAKKPMEVHPIPEIFSHADAVMLFDRETRQTYFQDYRFFSRNILHRRIKIQTQTGLEKYARIIIPKKPGMQIEILDARTIKKDGSIIDLDAKNDIKTLELADEDDLIDRSRYRVFSVPGVAVGDDIEMVAIQEGYHLEQGATVVMHDYIPVLKSEFGVEVFEKSIVIMATNYNQMPNPDLEKNLNNVKLTWKAENLPGLYEERGTIAARSLPHFIYELNLDRLYTDSAPPDIQTWSDLLHYLNKEHYQVRIRRSKKFNELFDNIVQSAASTSLFDRLSAIQQYLNEVKIVKIPEKEASEGMEYFLEKKKADYNTHMKLYKSLLEKLGVEYLIAAGRSKYLGPINLNFPTYLQISDLLFLIPDEQGGFIVLPTKSKNKTYDVNEFPIELYDTEVYMISPTKKSLFQVVTLNGPGPKKTMLLRKIKAKANLNEGTIEHFVEETYSGALSTRNRNWHYQQYENQTLKDLLLKDRTEQKMTSIDTISLSERPRIDPYKYELSYGFQTNHQITKLEEGVFKISLEHFLDHHLQLANENRLLDYYPKFAYTDGYTYYMEFDQPIKLVNKENFDLRANSPNASFECLVQQVNPTALLIKSKYTIKSNRIPVTDIHQLIEVNNAAQKADNEGLIVQLE